MDPIESHIKCPLHPKEFIKRVDFELGEEKELYCFECLLNVKNPLQLSSQLKTIDDFVEVAHKFYESNRQRASENTPTPDEYLDVLKNQSQNLDALKSHIEMEKKRVEAKFEEFTKEVLKIINTRKDEFFVLLDQQVFNYSYGYTFYQKQLNKAFPKADDTSLYPNKEELLDRFQKCKDHSEMLAFIRNVKEDIHENKLFPEEERSNPELARRNLIKNISKKLDEYKNKNPTLVVPEPDLSKIKVEFEKNINKYIDSIFDLQNEIEDLSTGGDGYPKSAIIKSSDFSQIRKWLDKEYAKRRFKPLFKGTKDGMTASKFHELCDNKGPTITLIKTKNTDKIVGGFMDQAWTSRGNYINTTKSFLFSINAKAKYIITEPNSHAQYGGYDSSSYGPTFGGGHDIYLANDFTSNSNYCNRYSYNFTDNNSFVGGYNFQCEEVEVYSLDK